MMTNGNDRKFEDDDDDDDDDDDGNCSKNKKQQWLHKIFDGTTAETAAQ